MCTMRKFTILCFDSGALLGWMPLLKIILGKKRFYIWNEMLENEIFDF